MNWKISGRLCDLMTKAANRMQLELKTVALNQNVGKRRAS